MMAQDWVKREWIGPKDNGVESVSTLQVIGNQKLGTASIPLDLLERLLVEAGYNPVVQADAAP